MPPTAVADGLIDLYIHLYDPLNRLVGISENYGTYELINIVLTMDATWSVYVDGWETNGMSADYDLYSWVLTATPGGSMSVYSFLSAIQSHENEQCQQDRCN
mmetsp:Transcript_54152/g.115062  ORF Transcript_54152/g.115062 Transcript_54152/m.115062 type:complete len:102 (-) Transcript_54152:251-556(-)|eukprot:CAMPEP_0172546912 /NCGR_PEP_ID=MMETSP1067-20121228/16583_1 /TAXON_ID=265564 ORGANISM="Thalassiosira punctigera, Strain Tpunct2005C2" /NCGR_SAMPLE_ID=MMETSP1067 /ASSEMBLY_ACC=CAM_ASM_000444 /LENGTH=101 /DNA_ID=CAMNT_0013333913 /DNA_START=44 /DNA_END=349 /DNA_ORIENTATION=-